MAKYKLSNAALADLDRLFVYGVTNFGLDRAESYSAGLIKHFESIARSPTMYPAVDQVREGYRRSLYGVNSVYYRVSSTHIDIIRVLGRENVDKEL